MALRHFQMSNANFAILRSEHHVITRKEDRCCVDANTMSICIPNPNDHSFRGSWEHLTCASSSCVTEQGVSVCITGNN